MTTKPLAVVAVDVPLRQKASVYPQPFLSRVEGRAKRQLGEVFGLKNFGVNLTTLAPGSQSALMHRHSKQDEFVYVLSGIITLVTEDAEVALSSGMCAGFPAAGVAHHLINRGEIEASYLEIGDRSAGDGATYPNDDLVAEFTADGWRLAHKDGTPY